MLVPNETWTEWYHDNALGKGECIKIKLHCIYVSICIVIEMVMWGLKLS